MNVTPLVINGYFVANLLISFGIAWVCVCRFAIMSRSSTRNVFRFSYVLVFVAAIANGGSRYLFAGEQPGPGVILIAASLLGLMLTHTPLWRDGVPPIGQTRPTPLPEDAT